MRGETSLALLQAFPKMELLMVDQWREVPSNDPYRDTGDKCARLDQDGHDAHYWHAWQATRKYEHRVVLMRMTSLDAAECQPFGSADAVFIDADHSYMAVCKDILAWWPVVRRGGILCGHDYGHPRERRRGQPFGVSRAVNEFCDLHGFRLQVGEGLVWWIHKGGINAVDSDDPLTPKVERSEEWKIEGGDALKARQVAARKEQAAKRAAWRAEFKKASKRKANKHKARRRAG